MPISRDPRMDRRRRVLRDTGEQSATGTNRKSRRKRSDEVSDEANLSKRGAGYSQDVRRACGIRLVQMIPVRRRSYAAAILVSAVVPAVLLTAHYMIYVSGSLPWYGHPLAVSLDASHYRSIASWFASHLWLMCLVATVLTYQLRRHKLDDYEGEYRLWFWLVLTCLIASIDATTHISDLFGLALDSWSQINLGWSGPAVVKTTLIALIGMLGLRLCSELKAVPTSLVFWLMGLVAWAGSAALGQELLKIELTQQFRIWLKVALWLGGLTCVWLAALSYLRSVYLEAQRRFLLRGRLAASSGMPLGQRLRESMPAMPKWRGGDGDSDASSAGRWRDRFGWGGNQDSDSEASTSRQDRKEQRRQQREQARARKAAERDDDRALADDETEAADAQDRRGLGRLLGGRRRSTAAAEQDENASDGRPSRWSGWLRKPKDSDEPDEYKKVSADRRRSSADDDEDDEATGKRWLPKLGRPRMPAIPKPNVKGMFSRFKFPGLRLPPPGGDEAEEATGLRPVSGQQELPGTDGSQDSTSSRRPMSKAERKRLRRQQQKQNRAA